jgi:N-acetylglutamate synthase-like GNAT family acetyltransferase
MLANEAGLEKEGLERGLLSDFFKFKNVTLKRITRADIDDTVAIINAAYKYQDAAKGRPRTDRAHLSQRVSASEFYVAKHGNEIVGCVYVERHGSSLHFGLLTVEEHLRGTGLGAALINAIEDYTKDSETKLLELDYNVACTLAESIL